MRQLYYSIRTLLRERGSNLIRVISLALGLTIGILLFSQIAFELSYEKCYPESEQLAIVRGQVTNLSTGEVMGDDGTNYDYTVFAPTAATLAQDLPGEVTYASCVNSEMENSLYYEDKLLSDVNYMCVDSCFFQVFGIPLLKGNLKDLMIPRSVFVSEHFARATFGEVNPIGKTLSVDKQQELTIRGVYKDTPANTMLTHDLVISIYTQDGGYQGGFGWKGNDVFYAFLRLRQSSDIEKVNGNIQRVMEKYSSSTFDDWKIHYSVIPLTQKHLDSSDVQKRLVIYGFLGFAIFFVAIMNYMLISIATLSRRAKGVGVHKCSGASSTHVFGMFLAETGILVLVSVLLSVLLIVNARELIEDLLSVRLSALFTWGTLWVPLLTIVVLFVLAGGVPGRLFSRIPVTQVFRRYTDGKKGWKRSLLFVQFAGVAFVVGLLLVTLLQYSHLMNRDMGINVPGLTEAESWLSREQVVHIKDELRRQPMVADATVATHSVLGQYWTRGLMSNDGKRLATLNLNYVHYNYPEAMGIEIVQGAALKNKEDLLVNEELVRQMKWTDGAVGKQLIDVEGTIVGVFANIRNESFYAPQSPMVLIANEEQANHTFNVRLKEPYDENLKRLNAFVEKTFPTVALRFVTVDGMIKQTYKEVYRFRNSVWITSCFILLIVVMGLIGYVNDETQRRSKEIAIRKVNGADASSILKLLMRDILYIASISVLLGATVAYFIGKAWLEQFAEQINLHPAWFALVVQAVLLLVVAVVEFRAWRIANENPVKSIKSE